MDLIKAFRLRASPRIAIVGAGGKTSLLFALAAEYKRAGKSALLTTTTHISMAETQAGDAHIVAAFSADFDPIRGQRLAGKILVTGSLSTPDRFGSLNLTLLDELNNLAALHDLPLLIEADGSGRRPLKAPGGHEPAIPEFVDTVIVVCGLSGIGHPLGQEYIHRSAEFGNLAAIQPGDFVTPEVLARVLAHPRGGLKNIPTGARKIVLLNQADRQERIAFAGDIATHIEEFYDQVVIADLPNLLNPKASQTNGGGSRIHAVHEKIAGVILAAGSSSRFAGQSKQTLLWRGKPLVRHVAEAGLDAGLTPIIIITGAEQDTVARAVKGLPVDFAHNSEWEVGQSTSVRVGALAIPQDRGAAVFLLSDQPQIPQTLIRGLIERHRKQLPPIVAPLIAGQRGNPVLFDRITFDELAKIKGDSGGRALFSGYPVDWLEWHDEGVLMDIDTVEDYGEFLERYPDNP